MSAVMETSSENTTDEYFCLICGFTGAEVQVSEKGLSTLSKVSVQREDGLHEKITSSSNKGTYVHERCRKSYTARKNIAKSTKVETTLNTRILRTLSNNFNYETHCLICAKEIDFENVRKHPNPAETISNIEYVKDFGKYGKVQTTLVELCNSRHDEESTNIKARIAAAGDIRAADSKYHRSCLQRFLSGRGTSSTLQNRRNEDSVNNNAFMSLTRWLTSQLNKQFTLLDLQQRLRKYLPEDVEPYSTKHLKRRLINHFGQNITFAEIDGKTNVFTFSDKANSILQNSYSEEEPDVEERVRQANDLGKHVKRKLEDTKENRNYPSPQDIDIDKLESLVPSVLLAFVNGLMRSTASENSQEKQRLEVVSLCHALMQASAPQPFLSPLILSTGLFIHQTTRSKVLLNALSKLGFSASYDQVMEFEKAAVQAESIEDLHPGIESHINGGGFCQWVADNFDYNEDTLTGYNTTHAMGIIACQTPASNHKIVVPRQNTIKTAADIASSGDFRSIIKPYRPTGCNLLSKKKFEKLAEIGIESLKNFLKLDALWMLSNSRFQVTPSWQGFMSEITQGECLCSSILYHPILPLNPQTDEAVHSTMVFIDKQRQKSGQCCAMLTFDQAIYAKGYKIKADNSNEFQHLQLRLGGFHQLMSFLGSGCKAMEGSGLEEVWSTVYARNTLAKMFEGKAYTKTLRACLLTCTALHTLVMTHEDNHQLEGGESETSTSANMFRELEELSIKLMNKEQVIPDITDSHILEGAYNKLEEQKLNLENSRTAKLWLNYMSFVSIVQMFIRAERTGNWQLHLKASQDMLPWFAATGHNNYAKYCRLYLQDWMNPCTCLLAPLRDGLFTVRRKDSLFWSGTWSDMAIEQSLMRAGKTQGGLINITHKDGARTKWLLSAHVIAQYTDAVRALTRTTSSCWFDHHRDLNPGRISQDFKDMQSILEFLKTHNPFKGGENSQLRNIATGLIADDRVNVDKVMTIGNKIQENLTNKSFGEVTLKKSNQAITFAVMKKPVKLSDGELIRMSSTEMYQRLLSLACASGPPSASVFSFELSAVAPSLFHEDGTMRKAQKSHLARHIINLDAKATAPEKVKTGMTVFDGCAVLQQMKWPKVGTLQDVCLAYKSTVQHKAESSSPSLVVFDSYEVTTTKELEQKRRRLMKTSEADVVVEAMTPVPSDQSSFLANKKNKQNFINLLSGYLQSSGIDVKHAGIEGDADVVIVREATILSKSHQSVKVISDDTDVLVLLIHHIDRMSSVYMQTRTCTISIQQAQLSIGEGMCKLLPFLHAVSGCDTTSSIYGFGKVRHFNYLSASSALQKQVLVFGDAAASKDKIQEAGETYVSGLYPGGCQGRTLNTLRYLNIASSRYVPIERMPPTSRACFFHSLRVHLQVNTWLQLRTVLNKEEYGFSDSGGNLSAVITDSKPAPPELLKEIRCACKSATKLCNSCNCHKMQIPCSVHCKCEGVCQNGIL